MKFKTFAIVGFLSLIFLGAVHTSAEARHHRRSHFGFGFGTSFVQPAYPVYQNRVVEYYYPVQKRVIVGGGQPAAVVYQPPVAVREVYVAPPVVPVRQTGFSWFFGW